MTIMVGVRLRLPGALANIELDCPAPTVQRGKLRSKGGSGFCSGTLGL